MSARHAALALALLGLALLADPWGWQTLRTSTAGQDWHRMLRVLGYVPTWGAVGLALMLQDRAVGRGLRVIGAAGLAGLLANLGKLLIRRERPAPDGLYRFRDWADRPWDLTDLGMPSGHSAVAFGAAFALGHLYPRTRPLLLALAAGCAMTRVMEGAHFLSDVVASVAIGALAAAGVARLAERVTGEAAQSQILLSRKSQQ